MDVTSYLLGKNSSGGGGGVEEYFESEQSGNFSNNTTFAARFLKKIPNVAITKPNFNYAFANYEKITTIPALNISAVTSMAYSFQNCTSLVSVPLLDTKNVTNMSYMFNGCTSLTTIPNFDTSKVNSMDSMFYNCKKLTDESLDNILQMCINSQIQSRLTLIGFSSDYYPASRIQALPHYQDFINAGWTIGY